MASPTPTAHHGAARAPVLLRGDAAGVATLTLNRPERYNALSEELLDALDHEVSAIARDPSVRVVVIAGAGPAFCAGHDLKEMGVDAEQSYYETLWQHSARIMLSLIELPQPVIARVHGTTTAAGCQLVAMCDLAVASSTARFAVSGVTLGLFCSAPSVPLSRNIARKRAFEMLVTGEFIDAATAERFGLVNRVAPPAGLDEAVSALARSISGNAPIAIAMGKRAFYQQFEQRLDEAFGFCNQVMARNMKTEDASAGIGAFIAKREKPPWKGR